MTIMVNIPNMIVTLICVCSSVFGFSNKSYGSGAVCTCLAIIMLISGIGISNV